MTEIISAAHISIGLFALWLLYFFGWRGHRVDSFRQHIFAVRDDLFDYAASGAIRFDDPAYMTLRSIANGTIRFAHQLTFTRVLALVGFSDIPRSGAMEAWMRDMQSRSPEVRDRLLQAHSEIAKAIFWHVILWSPLAWICVGTSVLARVAFEVFNVRLKIVHNPRDISAVLEQEALEQSELVDAEPCPVAS